MSCAVTRQPTSDAGSSSSAGPARRSTPERRHSLTSAFRLSTYTPSDSSRSSDPCAGPRIQADRSDRARRHEVVWTSDAREGHNANVDAGPTLQEPDDPKAVLQAVAGRSQNELISELSLSISPGPSQHRSRRFQVPTRTNERPSQ